MAASTVRVITIKLDAGMSELLDRLPAALTDAMHVPFDRTGAIRFALHRLGKDYPSKGKPAPRKKS